MPRIIEFEGRRIQVPDDATDEEIASILNKSASPAPAAEEGDDIGGDILKAIASPGLALAKGAYNYASEFAEPERRAQGARDLQIGLQGVGRTGADILGFPGDVGNAIADQVLSDVDTVAELFGRNLDFRFGPSPVGSNAIAEGSSDVIEALGGDIIPQEDMSQGERAAYNVNRFGTEAILGGGALARRAATRFAPGQNPRPEFGDSLVKPYADDPRRAFRGDAAAGAGSGVALTEAQEHDFGALDPAVELLAMLAGGVGGMAASDAPRLVERGVRAGYETMTSDPDIPRDANRNTTSRRTSRRASEIVQGTADNPKLAARNIGDAATEARRAGDPVATSGLLSEDTGLTSMEQAYRLRNRDPFIEQDKRLAAASSDRFADLTDPEADQSAATTAAAARPGQLAEARDAEALPLLREAEASGATVDPQPVVDVIEQKLATAKRPAVRNALNTAREAMKAVGSEELDTSVSGLYETRKTITDLIEGRGDRPTDRFAKKELIDVRDALDAAITEAEPRFGQYLSKYREGSQPLNELRESTDVARLMEDDPRNVARKLLSGEDAASADRMREITTALAGDPEAMRGWKAAVAETLSDKVRNVGGELKRPETLEGPVSIAKMRTVFKRHEDALSGIFSEDEMASLRRAHDILTPLEGRRQQATTGSPTQENKMLTGAWDALGTAMVFQFGAVHAGMIMYRLRRMMSLVPGLKDQTLDAKALNLVNRMWFDPDLAKHLLEAPVDELSTPRWNARLSALIAGGELAREDDVPEDELTQAIGGPVNVGAGDDLLEAVGG